MGKKRKAEQAEGDQDNGDNIKIKVKNNEYDNFLITFPSGYKPGLSKETWNVYEHATEAKYTLLAETVG